ncbi:uncharacterized protein LOC132713008 [Ruditapes philippinarum]|uniref:uncharacterized protein LOC132713008 n=1 Tax=Ruditapes philippinarum TaxID=129788 RepID=UPI00295BE895|nr:uncharacterized protein LOC132713008 [Ruditapes philippinarum]
MVIGILIFLVFQPAGAASSDVDQWCYNPPGTDCSWYKQCLVKRFPCEAANDSYAIGFGDTICNDFGKNRPDFSDLGKRWIDETRACLQKQLVPLLSRDNMTCQGIQKFAFQTHSYCYSTPPKGSPSFCDLPFSDWLHISWIVKQSLFRETSETVKQILQILGSCASTGLFGK